jgi:hypothetical protein
LPDLDQYVLAIPFTVLFFDAFGHLFEAVEKGVLAAADGSLTVHEWLNRCPCAEHAIVQRGVSQPLVDHFEFNEVGNRLIEQADIVDVGPKGCGYAFKTLCRIFAARQRVPYFLLSHYERISSQLAEKVDDNWNLISVTH